MDTVFVTGGTGFLGRHLVPLLCHSGYAVRLLTRRSVDDLPFRPSSRLTFIKGDVTDSKVVEQGARGCRYIVHAAGYFRFWGSEEDFLRTNLEGTRVLLSVANATRPERFVHISSVAVIGHPDPSRFIDEEFPPQPADPYQKTKLEAERLALRAWNESGLPVIVLRPGAFYGEFGSYAFNRLFFRDPMRGIIMQLNRGRFVTFPAYVPDVATAILAAFSRGSLGSIYNICDDPLTHREVFDIIVHEANLRYPRIPLPGWLGILSARALTALSAITRREPFYPINLQSYVYNYWRVSNGKARRELGFVPTPFAEGARKTIAWYRAGKPDTVPGMEC